MAKEDLGIKKSIEVGRKTIREANAFIIDTQCKCDHQTNKGFPAWIPTKKVDGVQMYMCTKCQKDGINLSKSVLNKDKIQAEMKSMSNVFDILKSQLNPENDEDAKKIKRIGKAQFLLEFSLIPIVDAVMRNDKKKNKKKSDQESSWGRGRLV